MEHHASPPIDLLAVIESHCASFGIPKSTFGSQAVGDPRFVDDLRDGREPRRKTVNRVLAFIAESQQFGALQSGEGAK